MVVDDLQCDAQEKNDIHIEDQNNTNKDDEFIVKNFDKIAKLSVVRHTEIKEREPIRKIQNYKKNKRMTNLSSYIFEGTVREMTVEKNEYNKLVYATAKVVPDLCSLKRKKKVNARKKPSWKQKMEKEIEHLGGELSILSELERGINVKGKISRKLKSKYKLKEGNITRVKETLKQRT